MFTEQIRYKHLTFSTGYSSSFPLSWYKTCKQMLVQCWPEPTYFPTEVSQVKVISSSKSWNDLIALASSSLWDVLLNRCDALFKLLGKQVTGSSTVGVGGGLQCRFQRLNQRLLQVLSKWVLREKSRCKSCDFCVNIRFLVQICRFRVFGWYTLYYSIYTVNGWAMHDNTDELQLTISITVIFSYEK